MARIRLISIEVDSAQNESAADIIRAALGQASAPLPSSMADSPQVLAPAMLESPEALTSARPLELAAAPSRAKDAPAQSRGSKPKAKKKPAGPAASPEAPIAAGGETIVDRILAALRKRPASSLELAASLGLQPQQVYAPCSILKSKGTIESRNDDTTDGTRRWYLVKR